jgi:hypothetical protein
MSIVKTRDVTQAEPLGEESDPSAGPGRPRGPVVAGLRA